MTLRLKLADSRHATLISAFAPTPDATDETKEGFYTALDSILANDKGCCPWKTWGRKHQ